MYLLVGAVFLGMIIGILFFMVPTFSKKPWIIYSAIAVILAAIGWSILRKG